MNKKHIIILCIITSLVFIRCQTEKKAVKRDYQFEKIKKILVLELSDFRQHPNSGDIAADMISYYLLKNNYNVIGREVINSHSKFEDILENAKQNNIDAIITGSVTKYSLSKKIHTINKGKKEINVKNDTTSEVSIKEDEKELVYSSGRVYGATTDLPYEIEATAGIIAKMIDVKTGETIWINRAESSGFTIESAVESAVGTLLSDFIEEE